MKKDKDYEDEEESYTDVYQMFEKGLSYQERIGISKEIPENVDFYENRHWKCEGRVTEDEQSKIFEYRPLLTLVQMIVDNKKSAILQGIPSVNLICNDDSFVSDKMSKFTKFQMKQMEMEANDEKACKDGLVKGTYIYHFYWDDKAVGLRGDYEGDLRCEIIDPLNIVFANPQEHDVQKQKYVIIRFREDVKSVRKSCEFKDKVDMITPDDIESNYDEDVEQEENGMVTVYLRYFRINGEVYFQKSTKNVMLHKPKPINPKVMEKLIVLKDEEKETGYKNEMYDIDSQSTSLPDSSMSIESEEEYDNHFYKSYLYPLEVGSFFENDKSIYGNSLARALIPNQKAINQQISAVLKNSQNLVHDLLVVKQQALQGQVITNESGQVIIDHTPGNEWGIKNLQSQQLGNGNIQLCQTLLEMTRSVSGSSEILTGEILSKNMSGTAIGLMQNSANQPIAPLKARFWKRSKERIVKILLQFYRTHYENKEFNYEMDDAQFEEAKAISQEQGIAPKYVSRYKVENFSGDELKNKIVNIQVEVGQGSQYSEVMVFDMINTLILNGNASKMGADLLEQYITLVPDSVLPQSLKSRFRALIDRQQRSENGQLKEALNEAKTLLGQAQEMINGLKGQVDYEKQLNASLQGEFASKINQANEQMGIYQKAFKEYDKTSSVDEKELNKLSLEAQGKSKN